ncbi:MAG: L-threonylcarbamoyladenylate synthase [Patescibacteria group bacterium]|nr:L-threonylcarbamoyladenylate synthase [Patescibacteria group bacterium]
MKILKITEKNSKQVLEQAVFTVKKQGIIICPTDTVYGLIADATDKNAVEKVFKVKKRKVQKPLPVFIKDLKTAKKLVHINKKQEEFLKKFWPGKLTAVLKAKTSYQVWLGVCKNGKIGLRIPYYKVLNSLLDELNCPVIATSANISGKKASGKIVEILEQFKYKKNKPDLVLDAGNLKESLPSTIIDLENVKVIREGEISKNQILNELKE